MGPRIRQFGQVCRKLLGDKGLLTTRQPVRRAPCTGQVQARCGQVGNHTAGSCRVIRTERSDQRRLPVMTKGIGTSFELLTIIDASQCRASSTLERK